MRAADRLCERSMNATKSPRFGELGVNSIGSCETSSPSLAPMEAETTDALARLIGLTMASD